MVASEFKELYSRYAARDEAGWLRHYTENESHLEGIGQDQFVTLSVLSSIETFETCEYDSDEIKVNIAKFLDERGLSLGQYEACKDALQEIYFSYLDANPQR